MEFDPFALAHPSLLELTPYQPGKPISECQREYSLAQVIKLASNENPVGFSPNVRDSLGAETANLSRYPDGSTYDLKIALSQHLKVLPEQLILGNGSEDVLKMVLQALVWGENQLIVSQYAFSAYKILAQGLRIKVKEVKAREWGVDLNAILEAIDPKTRMIIIANPNNPTGTYLDAPALLSFLQQIPPSVIVVCDEAYYEYALAKDYPQTLEWMSQFPNLIVTRTFSKVYGLAGFRIGYGIAHPKIIDLANRVRQPFNVNHLAQIAARTALLDQDFVKQSILINEAGKAQYQERFHALGLEFVDSLGNFFMVKLMHKRKDIYLEMLKKGIIIRPLKPYQLTDFFRITIGTEQENNACLRVLEEVLL